MEEDAERSGNSYVRAGCRWLLPGKLEVLPVIRGLEPLAVDAEILRGYLK